MSEFCGACMPGVWDLPPEKNDFAGWRDRIDTGEVWWLWVICEGCGYHAVDNAGAKLCDTPGYPDECGLTFGPCRKCLTVTGNYME